MRRIAKGAMCPLRPSTFGAVCFNGQARRVGFPLTPSRFVALEAAYREYHGTPRWLYKKNDVQPSTEQVAAERAVDAACIQVADLTAEVVEATLYVVGWKLAARAESLDGLHELLITERESSIQSYPHLPNLSQSSILRNVAENITNHIAAQWKGTAIADTKLKEAKAELKEAKAELKEAKAELKEAKANLEKAEAKLKVKQLEMVTHPTRERMIELLTKKENKDFFKIECEPLLGREEGLKAGADYIEAVYKRHPIAFCGNKTTVCATGGTPGIGKTALLNEIAFDAIKKKLPAIAATCSGRGKLATSLQQKVKEGLELDDAFANALLESHFGIVNTKLRFWDVIYALREAACHFHKLPLSPVRPLVLCIDELAQLDDSKEKGTPLSIKLARALMHYCDRHGPDDERVIFIFSHIQYTPFTDGVRTKSGRMFYKKRALFPLPLLADTKAALQLLAKRKDVDTKKARKLIKAYKEVPAVTAFVDGLGGHPRAIFDGLKRAINEIDAEEFFLGIGGGMEMAWKCVVAAVKAVSQGADKTVRRAFQVPSPDPLAQGKREETLVSNGVILKSRGRHVVSPVALMQWASLKKSEEQKLINSLFRTDKVAVEKGAEKKMEEICYRHDAALRAFNAPRGGMSKPFCLNEYYRGGTMDEKIGELKVTMKRPLNRLCLQYVDHFEKHSALKLLNQGRIVVSNKVSEQGIEYLVPFHKAGNKRQLIVVAVQCKFFGAKTKFSWSLVLENLVESVNAIFPEDEIVFVNNAVVNTSKLQKQSKKKSTKTKVQLRPIFVPVIMNTVPTTSVMPTGDLATNAILFNNDGLQNFFCRIAALRLLMEKATNGKKIGRR